MITTERVLIEELQKHPSNYVYFQYGYWMSEGKYNIQYHKDEISVNEEMGWQETKVIKTYRNEISKTLFKKASEGKKAFLITTKGMGYSRYSNEEKEITVWKLNPEKEIKPIDFELTETQYNHLANSIGSDGYVRLSYDIRRNAREWFSNNKVVFDNKFTDMGLRIFNAYAAKNNVRNFETIVAERIEENKQRRDYNYQNMYLCFRRGVDGDFVYITIAKRNNTKMVLDIVVNTTKSIWRGGIVGYSFVVVDENKAFKAHEAFMPMEDYEFYLDLIKNSDVFVRSLTNENWGKNAPVHSILDFESEMIFTE